MKNIRLFQGDITSLKVDAIVNAANNSLLGGGGVDGAIHQAAGEGLVEECRRLNGCATGDAKITKGYQLPAKYVIHTVGPVWHGGNKNEESMLAKCYQRSLELASENNVKSIAFPNISTGVYRFPKKRAAEIAIQEVQKFIKEKKSLDEVIFVVYDDENMDIYSKLLSDNDR